MPNIMESVSWGSTTNTLSLLKNDERNQVRLLNTMCGTNPEKTRYDQAKVNVLDPKQNQLYHVVPPIEAPLDGVSSIPDSYIAMQRNSTKNTLREYRDRTTFCTMKNDDFTIVPSSSERYVYMDTNYCSSQDNCDENSQGNSCSQLLLDSFPSTTVPNTVASFSSSSSTSASHDSISLPRRGRLKKSLQRKGEYGGHILKRQSSLLSFWSRRFCVYRKNCHSTVGDAVLTFMLFLAMLHLSW